MRPRVRDRYSHLSSEFVAAMPTTGVPKKSIFGPSLDHLLHVSYLFHRPTALPAILRPPPNAKSNIGKLKPTRSKTWRSPILIASDRSPSRRQHGHSGGGLELIRVETLHVRADGRASRDACVFARVEPTSHLGRGANGYIPGSCPLQDP